MTTQANTGQGPTRRETLGLGGGLALSLTSLGGSLSNPFVKSVFAGEANLNYGAWEDIYRKEWVWDKVTWGVHTNQCLPANCLFRVYSKNGIVWREEQAANTEAVSPDYPDFNPLGCQKGCSFHHVLTSQERLRYPLKRVGERGEGKWQRITWDQALTEVADAILDAHESHGPQSFVIDAPHLHAGSVSFCGTLRTGNLLGATTTDINVALSDEFKGITHTFGTCRQGFTADNFFDAELLIFSHTNMAYTAPPMYHFVTEARYNGTEIAILSPDFSPSCVSADVHIPIKTSSDTAFWMSICQVLVEENLIKPEFIAEQTDLPLLIRTDNGRFLRASDLGEGREDQLYFNDQATGKIVQAPRASLAISGKPALEGRWPVTLADGAEVNVEPGFARLQRLLKADYTPEKAAIPCNIAPGLIREMARKIAVKRTHLHIGWGSCKQHHGDLMERAAMLALALTGNWGKPGTGFTHFFFATEHAEAFVFLEKPIEEGGLQLLLDYEKMAEGASKAKDPEATHTDAVLELQQLLTRGAGLVPPTPWMYHHAGFDQHWDRKEWTDPALDRTFGEYLAEARTKSGEPALAKVSPDIPPNVLLYINHNPLRRQRGGRKLYVEELFPKAKMIFSIELRMSSSAAYSDILLPGAAFYEKDDLTEGFLINPHFGLQQAAVKPPGEAKPEWEIYLALHEKIAERAATRSLTTFSDNTGTERQYADVPNRFAMGGSIRTNQDIVRQFVLFNEATGIFPKGYTFEQLQKEGGLRMAGLGRGIQDAAPGTAYSNDRPFFSFEDQLHKKTPYPTYARRAQFYIDHEWFLEAGEAFPVHKDVPMAGGDYPFRIVGGHPRNSVHTLHAAVPSLMKLHRAQPVAFVNNKVCQDKGVADGGMIRMFNDNGSVEIMASANAAVGPDQILIYMWEPFQFKDWKSPDTLLVGMPKPTHFALEYGQLKYYFMAGTPTPGTDRGLRFDFEKV